MIRCLLILLILLIPAPAVPPPSLRVFTANDRGTPELLRGQRVDVVIELRSATLIPRATIQHPLPDGLLLEAANASSGDLVTAPFPSWAGVVSATQPINIVLTYRVLSNAVPGDRTIRAQAQAGGRWLAAQSRLRVCCIPAAPPAQHRRVWLAMARA